MDPILLILILVAAVASLLFLVLKLKIHAFIPPTPGPVAVSEIIGANLGWVIILGFAVGIPVVIIAGPLFGRYISGKVKIQPPAEMFASLKENDKPQQDYPAFRLVVLLIGTPLVLILCNTITGALVNTGVLPDNFLTAFIVFIGHPFSALLIATFLAIYLLGENVNAVGAYRSPDKQEFAENNSTTLILGI